MADLYQEKVNKWDAIVKVASLLLAVTSFIIISVGVWKVFQVAEKLDQTTLNTQQIIQDNQKIAFERTQANIQRQNQTNEYIKCIALYNKKNPTFDFQSATLEEAEAVLDSCAKAE